MAKKFKICHIHPNCSIPDQSTAQETIISNNIWMMCLPRNPLLSLCMLISTITKRFLCDFSIESWLIYSLNKSKSIQLLILQHAAWKFIRYALGGNLIKQYHGTQMYWYISLSGECRFWSNYLNFLSSLIGVHTFFFINAHECTY